MQLYFKHRKKIKPNLSKHCMGTLVTKSEDVLFDGKTCLEQLRAIIIDNEVQCLGEQLHQFPNGSYTLLITLAESHISIHTWPERLTVQLDVFLCNYMNDNSEKCENIYNDIVEYFDCQEINTTIVERL